MRTTYAMIESHPYHATLLLGAGEGSGLAEVLARRAQQVDRDELEPVTLVEPDAERARDAIRRAGAEARVAAGDLRLASGSDWAEQLHDLALDAWWIAPTRTVTLDAAARPDAVKVVLASAGAERRARVADLARELARRDACGGRRMLAARIERGDARVLVRSSRFTTYQRFAARDLGAGLAAAGCVVTDAVEPHVGARWTPLAVLSAIEASRADVVAQVNWSRRAFGVVPRSVPLVTWVMDDIAPVLASADGIAAWDPDDLVLTYSPDLLRRQGMRARLWFLPPVVNEVVWAPRPRASRAAAPIAPADVGYVANCLGTRDELCARPQRMLGEHTGEVALAADVIDRVLASHDGPLPPRTPLDYRDLLASACDAHALEAPEELLEAIARELFERAGNMRYRQVCLEALSDAGIRVALYGRGWAEHAPLAQHARGVVENGPALADVYRAHPIHLQLTHHVALHQRLVEGLTAEAFFLVRRNPWDRWSQLGKKALDALDAGARDAEELTSIDPSPAWARWVRNVDVMSRQGELSDAPIGDRIRRFAARIDLAIDRYVPVELLDEVSFDGPGDVVRSVLRFLDDAPRRRELGDRMRAALVPLRVERLVPRALHEWAASLAPTKEIV